MRKISAYETTDGTIFKDRVEAERHESRYTFEIDLGRLLNATDITNSEKGLIENCIIENAERLKEIFDSYNQPQRQSPPTNNDITTFVKCHATLVDTEIEEEIADFIYENYKGIFNA